MEQYLRSRPSGDDKKKSSISNPFNDDFNRSQVPSVSKSQILSRIDPPHHFDRHSSQIFTSTSRVFTHEEPKANSSRSILIALFLLILLLFFYLSLKFVFPLHSIDFCSVEDLKNSTCEPCPLFASCEKGKIAHCAPGYLQVGNNCVFDSPSYVLAQKIGDWLVIVLANKNGNNGCSADDRAFVEFKSVEASMRKRFGSEPGFQDALEILKDKLTSNRQPFLEPSFDEHGSLFLSSKQINKSILCHLNKSSKSTFLRPLTLTVGIILIGIFFFRYLSNQKFKSMAEKTYRELLDRLEGHGVSMVNAKELISMYHLSLSSSDRNKIYREMNEIRRKEERVGVIHEGPIEMWVKI